MRTYGVILAGGKSSRMGTNKALLPINNKSTIEHVADTLQACTDEIVIMTNNTNDYSFLGYRQYVDRHKDKGPLAGLESALYHLNADRIVVAACDMPFLRSTVYQILLEQLKFYDAVIPVFENKIHPLSAVYRRSVLETIQRQIEKNDLKIKHFLDLIHVKYVDSFPQIKYSNLQKHFFNMNERSQYEAVKRI